MLPKQYVRLQFDEDLTSPDQLKSAAKTAGYGAESSNTATTPAGGKGCCG
jgi:copper chaperone